MVSEQGVRRAHGAMRGDADTNLVRAARAGAREAYGELVRRYQDRIYSVISGMVADPEDALDLTQDAIVQVGRSIGAMARIREHERAPSRLSRLPGSLGPGR